MGLIKEAHEVLEVETLQVSGGVATVSRHHSMFAHVTIGAPATVAVSGLVTITSRLARWDDRQPITDEERDLVVRVNGQQVEAVTTVNGTATTTLQFNDPGIYMVEVTGELVTGANAEVVVA